MCSVDGELRCFGLFFASGVARKRRNMGSGPSRNTVDTPWRHLVYVAANTPPDACLAGYMGIGLRGTCVTLAYRKECILFFAHLIDTPLEHTGSRLGLGPFGPSASAPLSSSYLHMFFGVKMKIKESKNAKLDTAHTAHNILDFFGLLF